LLRGRPGEQAVRRIHRPLSSLDPERCLQFAHIGGKLRGEPAQPRIFRLEPRQPAGG
jgi:hypothetical protein